MHRVVPVGHISFRCGAVAGADPGNAFVGRLSAGKGYFPTLLFTPHAV